MKPRATNTTRTAIGVVCLAFALFGAAWSDAETPKPALPAAPALLSLTGLYGDAGAPPASGTPSDAGALPATGTPPAAGALSIDPRVRAYSPQYPLWSDGAAKHRWVYLPPGKQIDARRVDSWTFPVGTKFWKEFEFAGKKVETRLLWKATADAWVFATYEWNEAQTDAALVPADGHPNAVEIAPGKRHSIPSVLDCKACHDSRRTEILGFTALQLSTDRDPNAPHAERLEPGMVTLRELVSEKRLRPAREELLQNPPRVPGSSPRARAVLGYFTTNCASCHNPENPIASLGLLLQYDPRAKVEAAAPGLVSTVGVRGTYSIPKSEPHSTRRIAPGSPETSSVLHRMASRRLVTQMPPLGTVLVDEQAVALVRKWIEEDLGGATTKP